MFYVYTYYSLDDKKFYIGYTSNLKRRIKEHKNKKVASTANRKDMQLVFFEAYLSEKDARRRERYFKSSKGKKVLRQMLRDSIDILKNL